MRALYQIKENIKKVANLNIKLDKTPMNYRNIRTNLKNLIRKLTKETIALMIEFNIAKPYLYKRSSSFKTLNKLKLFKISYFMDKRKLKIRSYLYLRSARDISLDDKIRNISNILELGLVDHEF